MIKIMIALSNNLFSEGVSKLLEGDAEINIVHILRLGEGPYEKIDSLKPDVILVDFPTLYNVFGDKEKMQKIKFILFDTCCGEENIISAVIAKEIKGALLGSADLFLLKKAIRAVAKGEIWLDNRSVKNLISGLNAIKKKDRTIPLSDREKEIASLVGQGYRNKEIANRLCISEPTVKSHINRIFHKLDVKNRPQLITFAINEGLQLSKPDNVN